MCIGLLALATPYLLIEILTIFEAGQSEPGEQAFRMAWSAWGQSWWNQYLR